MNRLSHKFLRFVLFLLVGIGGISCSEPPSPEELAAAEQVGAPGIYAQVCAACHGAAGEGKEELFSPSITGLPVWYVEEQLQKFRGEQRGIHPEDVPGQQMRAISLTLTDEQIAEATAAVAAMPIIRTQPTTEPFDLEKARYRYANECMECHRYNVASLRTTGAVAVVWSRKISTGRKWSRSPSGLRTKRSSYL